VPADDHCVVWLWVLGGLLAWLVVALGVGVLIGKGIRLVDQRSESTPAARVLTIADVPSGAAGPAPVSTRTRRRAVPLPPVGVALAALAVALETIGYLLRLTGATGQYASLFSMDAPYSVPRLFVALLFAVAAVAAVAGAGSRPGRRTWWLAIAVVAGGVAAVKAGSTVHSDAVAALEALLGTSGTILVSALVAGTVIGVLWILSRTERRDRRRLLGVLVLYAGASVGLSAVSSLTAAAYGGASRLAIAATFVEESGEALAGVAFLIGVLVGVAPRLVLPAAWALRRQDDAQSLELPEVLPGRTGGVVAN
jgi:hypothetical protein